MKYIKTFESFNDEDGKSYLNSKGLNEFFGPFKKWEIS